MSQWLSDPVNSGANSSVGRPSFPAGMPSVTLQGASLAKLCSQATADQVWIPLS